MDMKNDIVYFGCGLCVRYSDIVVGEKRCEFMFVLFMNNDKPLTVWMKVIVQQFFQDYDTYLPVYNTFDSALLYDESKIMDGITTSLLSPSLEFYDGEHKRYWQLCEQYMSEVISDAFRLASYLFMMV